MEDFLHSHVQVFNLRACSRTVFYRTETIFYPYHGRWSFIMFIVLDIIMITS